jgi:hypothetical protein
MEWASSTEESELCGGPIGFSLLVYAWRKWKIRRWLLDPFSSVFGHFSWISVCD